MSKKFVMIQAVPPPGFSNHGEAFRLWPADRPVRVEILETEEDGAKVPVKRTTADGVKIEEDHNPTVIGQRSYRALQANPRIRILSDGAVVAGAEIAAAQGQVAALTADKIQLTGDLASLDQENTELRARVASLEEALKLAQGTTVVPLTGNPDAPGTQDAADPGKPGKNKAK